MPQFKGKIRLVVDPEGGEGKCWGGALSVFCGKYIYVHWEGIYCRDIMYKILIKYTFLYVEMSCLILLTFSYLEHAMFVKKIHFSPTKNWWWSEVPKDTHLNPMTVHITCIANIDNIVNFNLVAEVDQIPMHILRPYINLSLVENYC